MAKGLMKQLPMVDPSRFAMVPRSDVPRSTFESDAGYKTTFNVDELIPIFIEEVLPGDVFNGQLTVFARMANLVFPLMDNLKVETFFFFVPNRIVWDNWKKFMGEQVDPSDSIAYTIPQTVSPAGGWVYGSLADYFGLPIEGQVTPGNTVSVSALPFRGMNLIYNEWFRDQNLQDSLAVPKDDGPDSYTLYNVVKRNKQHDYFTSCLPWPLKGGQEISLPVGGTAVVKTSATDLVTGAHPHMNLLRESGSGIPTGGLQAIGHGSGVSAQKFMQVGGSGYTAGEGLYPSNLYADLSTATGATINAMRLAVASQQFLEKDARGGTRYTEVLKNHFGVTPEDARLQRPEYCGGGRSMVQTSAIPQTSATGLTGGTTPVGSLTGQATVADAHRFSYHATEHGYLIGLVNVTGAITYQQGIARMWSRETRFDFYWPTFANLGEQAVLSKELYATGAAEDDDVFGYQERWAEYRYRPSRITGNFRSTNANNIDEWHLAQQFGSRPTLSSEFVTQATPTSRVLAAGAEALYQQVLFDSVCKLRVTRPVPAYSVPGLARF